MAKTLHVHFLPELTSPEELRGATVVMIDVLRSSTTMTEALAVGAREVIPCVELEEVRTRGAELPREELVLGGERGGKKIDLFDLGNSPTEYTAETVAGKTVIFTTTNGMKALDCAREAYEVLIGAPVNLSAICSAIAETRNVHLLCAGTDGQITREDVLAAGAITYQLTRKEETAPQLNDSAHLARAAWRNVVAGAVAAGEPLATRLAHEYRATLGGQNLLQIGLELDLVTCAEIDRHSIVPKLDLRDWRIRLE